MDRRTKHVGHHLGYIEGVHSVLDFGERVTAALLLIVASPLLLIIATAVRVRLGAPVTFDQVRIGYREQAFVMHKFRTMTDARDSEGRLLSAEQRITPFGRWLRKTSLDELPELWNVLRGEMSFVGPRPLLPDYLPHYTDEQRQRHNVKPGITGLAQIEGRSLLRWEEKLAKDVWYVQNKSILLDANILFRTARAVITRKGTESAGTASRPPGMRPPEGGFGE